MGLTGRITQKRPERTSTMRWRPSDCAGVDGGKRPHTGACGFIRGERKRESEKKGVQHPCTAPVDNTSRTPRRGENHRAEGPNVVGMRMAEEEFVGDKATAPHQEALGVPESETLPSRSNTIPVQSICRISLFSAISYKH